MVADKEVAKLADMVAGHGDWLIGLKLFDPNLTRRLACLLSIASLFISFLYYFPKIYRKDDSDSHPQKGRRLGGKWLEGF